MKKLMEKIYSACIGIAPIVATVVLVKLANSTACWLIGQDEMPEGTKKYRKF